MTSTTDVSSTADLRTPALVVDRQAFDANVAAMSAVRPGRSLRPHVKAFKSTALARELVAAGHPTFCAATPREIEGLALAGVGDDLLLANESFDVARLGALSDRTDAVITVAVDSDEILDAAIDGGVRSVLLDIDVGLPRCGCDIDTAERLAERARGAGLDVRGVMGYEGHLMMMENGDDKTRKVGEAMAILLAASERIGGDIVSGGGTGTYATNTWCTEIQAGSYTLLDTEYATLDSPFEPALRVLATVVSTSAKGWIIADAGLKAFGMDHGAPTWDGPGKVLYCSDEHVTLIPDDVGDWRPGDRVLLLPAHVDPTIARHETMWVTSGDDVVAEWPVDLRHW
ncbi:MAG: alanine racemase [Ilumatobacter sp.]|uniref:alanine racemase n=1 Tax=Ilumatobacter sp. TaxID=1967498 RepID=UPI003299676E